MGESVGSTSQSWGERAGDATDKVYLFTMLSRFNSDPVKAVTPIQMSFVLFRTTLCKLILKKSNMLIKNKGDLELFQQEVRTRVNRNGKKRGGPRAGERCVGEPLLK